MGAQRSPGALPYYCARVLSPIYQGLRGRPEEAQEVRGMVSPSTGRRYPLTMICSVFRTPRSSVYALAATGANEAVPEIVQERARPRKRGPKTALCDEAL